jgi:tetratricopeptide (TPR) repeat protein
MALSRTNLKSVFLFCSYSHKDEGLRDELDRHLSALKRQGILYTWHDRKISAGREWEGEIDKNLEAADIILLLISADFLGSDYCHDREMKRALEKHEAGQTRVIPILIRPVDWHGEPFEKLQALPTDAKPVTSWRNRDQAWTNVVKGLREAIEDILRVDLQLRLPFTDSRHDLTVNAASALTVLQVCPHGVPFSVLAQALACSQQDLEKDLASLVVKKILAVESGLYSLTSPPSSPNLTRATDVLSRTLEELLAFIEVRRGDDAARSQVLNAVELAKKCAPSRPTVVVNVFRILDKLLKRRGDKRFILDVAELSLDAAQRATRTRQVIEGEAHALICGRSWVFQRVGRLAEARVAAERSLRLGDDIGWDRNTAYCKKCIGRLYRLEAERAQGKQKAALLSQSIAFLKDAIERFGKMGDFGPTHPEVGDCYSLLGRTYLVAGQTSEAEKAVRQAHRLIPDRGSKDYLDLAILSGDLQVVRGDRRTAASFYDEALHLRENEDPEISEMCARAYMARGRNNEGTGEQQGAESDYGKAAEIYQRLGEREAAASARWEEFRLKERIPREAFRLLHSERPTVPSPVCKRYFCRGFPKPLRRWSNGSKS